MRAARLLPALTLTTLAACGGSDAVARTDLLDAPAMRRLDGGWDVSFEPDPGSTTFAMRAAHGAITGSLVLAIAHHGPFAMADMRGITHEGVYDLDFSPFGWTTRGPNDPAVVIASFHPRETATAGAGTADSVFVELSPGTSRFSVRMQGVLQGDSVSGSWLASSFSSGGGSGRFVMRRSRAQP